MSSPDLWADPEMRRQYLASQLNESALCLVLGAGVSKPLGLPDWEGLLANMYLGNESSRPAGTDLKRQAEHFKTRFCDGRDEEFNERVKSALYRAFDIEFATLRRNDLLGALGALVMSSVRGRAAAVINFNFDDLLEIFLEYHGFVVQSVGDDDYWTRAADVQILHPHGLLPFATSSARRMSRRILLDQREYSRTVGDERHPWRQRLLSAMRSSSCLFIGTSGLDDNMDSLISRAEETHASKSTSTAYWGIWLCVDPTDERHSAWKERGVFPVTFPGYDSVSLELFSIVQTAAIARRGS